MADEKRDGGIPSDPVDELSRVGRELLGLTILDNVDLPTAMSAAFPGAPISRTERSRDAVLEALRDLIDWKLVLIRSFVDGEQVLEGSGRAVTERLTLGWDRYSEPALVEIECTARGRVAMKEYTLRRGSAWLGVLQALRRMGELQLTDEEHDLLCAAGDLLDTLYQREFENW